MLALPLFGPVLFGAVTVWAMAPLLLLFLAGALLVALRPLITDEVAYGQPPPGGMAYLLFVVYALLLIPFSAVPYSARFEGLKIVSYAIAFWAWTQLSSPHKRWRMLLGLVLFSATLIALYAIIQHLRGSTLILFEPQPAQYAGRASGTYICPNHFANLVELLIPFALALLFTHAAGGVLRLLSAYSLLIFLPAMFLTQSRSGWLATLAGVGVTACLLTYRRHRRLFYFILLGGPVVAALLVTVLWFASPMFQTRVSGMLPGSLGGEATSRLAMWKDTIAMIKDAPIFGLGPGAFEWFYDQYQSHTIQLYYDYAHNEYLQLIAEYGFVGLLLLGAAIVVGLVRMLRTTAAHDRVRDANLVAALTGAVAAALVHACFDFNFHIYANNHVLILLAGVTAGALYSSGSLSPVQLSGWKKYPAVAGPVLVILIAGVLTLRAFESHRSYKQGTRKEKKLQLDAAADRYRAALWWESDFGTARLALANVLYIQSFWSLDPENKATKRAAAIAGYRETLVVNPRQLEAKLGLAKALQDNGDVEGALQLYMEIIAHARYNRFFLTQVGLELKKLGYREEARQFLERAVKLGASKAVRDEFRDLQPTR